MAYCIYSGVNMEESTMNIEHIIPLSLGGCDDFTIKVSAAKNNEVNAKVDAKMASDSLVKFHQIHLNHIGHSKTKPVLKIKGKTKEGKPLSIHYSKEAIDIFDPIEKKRLLGKQTTEWQFQIDMYVRLQFISKVALATGYFLFNDTFVNSADCEALRQVVFADDIRSITPNIRFYDTFQPPTIARDKEFWDITKLLMAQKTSSSVVLTYSPNSMLVFVGIGGELLGCVNFEATITDFPIRNDLYDLGTVLEIERKKLIHDSLRNRLSSLLSTYDIRL